MTMAKPTYYELLRDPRWYRRRAQVIELAGRTCQECGYCQDDQNQDRLDLNVHHKKYFPGKAPWEYEDDLLICLCEICHDHRHDLINNIRSLLGKYDKNELLKIFAFVRDFRHDDRSHKQRHGGDFHG